MQVTFESRVVAVRHLIKEMGGEATCTSVQERIGLSASYVGRLLRALHQQGDLYLAKYQRGYGYAHIYRLGSISSMVKDEPIVINHGKIRAIYHGEHEYHNMESVSRYTRVIVTLMMEGRPLTFREMAGIHFPHLDDRKSLRSMSAGIWKSVVSNDSLFHHYGKRGKEHLIIPSKKGLRVALGEISRGFFPKQDKVLYDEYLNSQVEFWDNIHVRDPDLTMEA